MPDKHNNNGMSIAAGNWEDLIPVCSKEVKAGESDAAIFKMYTTSIHLMKEEWLVNANASGNSNQLSEPNLKLPNTIMIITGFDEPFLSLVVNKIQHYCFSTSGAAPQALALYEYIIAEKRTNNITDWALQLFNAHYRQNEPASPVCYAGSSELRAEFLLDIPPANTITKEAIFQYVYAVLHHPAYRAKYSLNLKREFPRIPLYDNFHQWAAWGKKLMDLHIHYETATPYPLERKEIAAKEQPTAKLRAVKEEGIIQIDDNTELCNIPPSAWDYKLGNRSALEWMLDEYKEKQLPAPTIAGQFNTYHLHDYKEHVINLLQRVCTVSVETIKIINAMP